MLCVFAWHSSGLLVSSASINRNSLMVCQKKAEVMRRGHASAISHQPCRDTWESSGPWTASMLCVHFACALHLCLDVSPRETLDVLGHVQHSCVLHQDGHPPSLHYTFFSSCDWPTGIFALIMAWGEWVVACLWFLHEAATAHLAMSSHSLRSLLVKWYTVENTKTMRSQGWGAICRLFLNLCNSSWW